MALKEFQGYLNRWPAHNSVADVRITEAQLIESLRERINDWKIPKEKAMSFTLELEQVEQSLFRGEYRRGIDRGEALIRRYPHSIPVYSKLSKLYWREGQESKAIESLEKVLHIEPENLNALAELTRYYLLTGKIKQAKSNAERIIHFSPDTFDNAIKIVEALSYLGDDLGVLNIMHNLEQRNVEIRPDSRGALLLHLAAVSYYRTGKESEARQLWKKALQFSPGFNLAAENLRI